MGRRETPLRTSNRTLSELALWLRSQRQDAGLTYAQLAARTGVSPSSLSRATKGERAPSLAVVEAFADGCGADKRKAVTLWREARYNTVQRPGLGSDQVPMLPQYIHNFVQLHAALVELYKKAGSPPLRRLESSTAGRHGRLPRSSVSRVLRGQAIPRKELLVALVQACTPSRRVDTNAWVAAWEQANRVARYDRDVYRSGSAASGADGLRSAVHVAQERLDQLTEVRAVRTRQRAEILASYQGLPSSEFGTHHQSGGFLEARIEEDPSQSHKQVLLRQLINTDAAVTNVQVEIEELAAHVAALRRRLKGKGARAGREEA
jgi:transcriptional regulator with XRE-family HTH domain